MVAAVNSVAQTSVAVLAGESREARALASVCTCLETLPVGLVAVHVKAGVLLAAFSTPIIGTPAGSCVLVAASVDAARVIHACLARSASWSDPPGKAGASECRVEAAAELWVQINDRTLATVQAR